MRMLHGFILGLLLAGMAVLSACPAKKSATAPPAAQAPAVGQKIPAAPQAAPSAAAPVGTPPQGLTVTAFTVTGMTCNDCSSSIEATLIKMPGVTTVSADWKAGTTKVQYDADKCTPAEFIAAIEKLGFTAQETATGAAKTPGAAPAPASPGAAGGAKTPPATGA